jgi:hypothetical protein
MKEQTNKTPHLLKYPKFPCIQNVLESFLHKYYWGEKFMDADISKRYRTKGGGGTRNVFRILIGKSEGKKSLGRPMRIYESRDNF